MDYEISPETEAIIDGINDLANAYKEYYGFVFDINIPRNSGYFKSFMKNSKDSVLRTITKESERFSSHLGSFIDMLFERFESKIIKKQTGFAILKQLFYISFAQAIEDHMDLNDSDSYVTETIEGYLLQLFESYTHTQLIEGAPLNNWFRGQSNFEWNLLPSLYRNIDGKKLVHIDNNYIFDLYKKFGLIEKYGKTIGWHYTDYDFQSFMQHSVSLSPFLDFSTNPIVSTVMALSDTTAFKQHYEKDSALYEIVIRSEKITYKKDTVDRALMNFNAYYCETIPFFQTLSLKGRMITIDSIDSLIEALSPSVMFIDIPSNDRMRYQSGKFVLFHDCLVLKDKVYAELCPNASLRIYKISKSFKAHVPGMPNLLETIVKRYPQFSPHNMMNPYDYFSD